jgi:hypothetical protein
MKKVWLRAVLHSAESKFSTLQSRLAPRIRNRIRKYFRVFIRGLGEVDLWKIQRSKISWDCLFNVENSFAFQEWLAYMPEPRCQRLRIPALDICRVSDSCNGDSGGGLVSRRHDQVTHLYQRAIQSTFSFFSIFCHLMLKLQYNRKSGTLPWINLLFGEFRQLRRFVQRWFNAAFTSLFGCKNVLIRLKLAITDPNKKEH